MIKRAVLILWSLSQFAPQFSWADLEIALTVDDLPIHGVENKSYSRLELERLLLATFRKHRLPPTYGFVNAIRDKSHPVGIEILREWVAGGNPVGNHTYSHADLRTMSAEKYIADIARNEPTLEQVSNGADFRVFRYPYLLEGETFEKRNAIRDHLFGNGYQIAEVTMDWWDFQWNQPLARCLAKGSRAGAKELRRLYVKAAVDALKFSEEFSERLFGRQIKHILLTHIGVSTALFLDEALTAYEREGVRFIDLRSAMGDELYRVNPQIVSRHGPNFLDMMYDRQRQDGKKVQFPPFPKPPLKELAALCR